MKNRYKLRASAVYPTYTKLSHGQFDDPEDAIERVKELIDAVDRDPPEQVTHVFQITDDETGDLIYDKSFTVNQRIDERYVVHVYETIDDDPSNEFKEGYDRFEDAMKRFDYWRARLADKDGSYEITISFNRNRQ